MQIIIDYDEKTHQLQVQNIPNNMVIALGIMSVATETVKNVFTAAKTEENRIQPVHGALPVFPGAPGTRR